MRLLFPPAAMVVACACAAQVPTSHQEQQPWQKIQMLTASQVAARWVSPPAAYGPDVATSLNGDVTVKDMAHDLDAMKAMGFGAVAMQGYGRGLPYRYLSPAYFKFFRAFVGQARKRGIKVWIVDDAGYPSGFAGGKFTKLKANLRMQGLEVAKKIPLSGGATISRVLSPNAVAALAINGDGVSRAIPIVNHVIHWKAPAGKWIVRIIDHNFITSPTRSATNPTGRKDRSQSIEDYLDPAATRQYIAWTEDKYKRYVGNEFGKTIMGFRGDEPDYSIPGLPWTNSFFDRFKRIKGYDIRPYVAGFFAPTMTEEERLVRADYWDVFSRMFSANFFGLIGKWCKANHLQYQVHLNHEEREIELAHSEGSFFRDMRDVEVPGIDAIWHQVWSDTISDYPRLAPSEAHVYGKPRAFTESFAAYHPEPGVAKARYILNEQFVRGVNLVEVMFWPIRSGNPRPPSRSFLSQPGAAALMHYTRRMSYLMSMGRPDASVALFLPTSSLWLGGRDAKVANRDFVSTERLLSEHQVDFDIVDADALAKDLIAGKGTFQTLSGNRYRTVILPGETLLSQAVLDRLQAFAKSGGHVLFLGKTPDRIWVKDIRNARPATPADFAWATVDTSAQLSATPTPSQYPSSEPPKPQNAPVSIVNAVYAAIPHRDLRLNKSSTALRYMRRELKDASVYLFFNEGDHAIVDKATLYAKGTKAQIWDPQTGGIKSLPSTPGEGSLTIQLDLQPYQTQVVVVRR